MFGCPRKLGGRFFVDTTLSVSYITCLINNHLFLRLFLRMYDLVFFYCLIQMISNDYEVLLGSWGFKAQFFYSMYLDYKLPAGSTSMFLVYSLDRRLPLVFVKSLLLLSSGLPNNLKRGNSGNYPPTTVFFEVLVEGVGNCSSALTTLGIELDRLGSSLSLFHSAMIVLSSISRQLSCFLLAPRNLLIMAGLASSGLNNSPN